MTEKANGVTIEVEGVSKLTLYKEGATHFHDYSDPLYLGGDIPRHATLPELQAQQRLIQAIRL